MKRVELKRVAELLWKSSKEDEKKPFARQASVSDNGSIEKGSSEIADSLKLGKEEEPGPLSLGRKVCFVLSFNVWVLYFLMLGWVIPCLDSDCGPEPGDIAERNFSGIWPLTNLEPYNVRRLPSMLMLGYAEGASLGFAAVDAGSDAFRWNRSVAFIPRRVQCEFESPFDANGDGIGDCLLTGYNDVVAFNASDGFSFWSLSLPSDDGNIVSRFHPTGVLGNRTFLVGTSGLQVLVVDAQNGTRAAELDLPCWSPFDVRIVPGTDPLDRSRWTVVCDYGDKLEAWSFSEEDLLNKERQTTLGSGMFSLFFRRESNSGGSIDLGCDAIAIPEGPLLLSWSDRVAMVASTRTAWERVFPYPLTVAGIKIGHFTSSGKLQVAAAVLNASSSIIHVLNMTSGASVASVFLENRHVQEISKVSAGSLDSMVVKSIVRNYTSYGANNMTDPISADEHDFILVEFNNSSPVIKTITTSPYVVGSVVNSKRDGEDDLILLKALDNVLNYQKFVIHRAEKDMFCPVNSHPSHFASEM